VVGCCEHDNETFTFHYLQGISRLAEELLAFHEELGCFEVDSCMLGEKELRGILLLLFIYLFIFFSYEQIHFIPFDFIVF
jgi:hypothetical protein